MVPGLLRPDLCTTSSPRTINLMWIRHGHMIVFCQISRGTWYGIYTSFILLCSLHPCCGKAEDSWSKMKLDTDLLTKNAVKSFFLGCLFFFFLTNVNPLIRTCLCSSSMMLIWHTALVVWHHKSSSWVQTTALIRISTCAPVTYLPPENWNLFLGHHFLITC